MNLYQRLLPALFLAAGMNTSAADTPDAARVIEHEAADNMLLLQKGNDVMHAGNPLRAINEFFDPVIRRFETAYEGSDKHIYSARNQVQALLYAGMDAGDKKGTIVLDATWADAYLLKAYALSELGRVADARKVLESALALSPMTSQFHSELAYTFIAEHNWDKAMASYRTAEEVTELGSDEALKNLDLARAWRGQGYVLVELGKLDEALALYQKCLKLDAHDEKARGEIKYIEELRSKSRS